MPRIEFDPREIGFTLMSDDDTLREIDRMKEEAAQRALNAKPILFR